MPVEKIFRGHGKNFEFLLRRFRLLNRYGSIMKRTTEKQRRSNGEATEKQRRSNGEATEKQRRNNGETTEKQRRKNGGAWPESGLEIPVSVCVHGIFMTTGKLF